jgi:hypothetical protein
VFSPHQKLAALKTRRTTGQTSSSWLTRVLLAYAAVMAETRMAIGLTCESFSKQAFEMIWQEQDT